CRRPGASACATCSRRCSGRPPGEPVPPRAAMMSNAKIRAEHLARPAIVYVRQSTLDQVRHHQESRRRQYDLAEHARTLGWREVLVIDEDLGKSGATAADRTGFQRLVAEVSLGRVGAVVGLEVSRLARHTRDWYQLLDLCGLLNTLLIDAAGLYDPRQLLLWLHQEQVTLPVPERDPVWGDRLSWRLPHYNSILNLLQNPLYAGAYAFGRTETRTHVVAGAPHTTRGHHRPREQWLVLLRDHHEGYISWDAYERNQHLLADNAQMKGQMAAGAVRGGRSGVAGLLRCASCGRRLHVTYSGGASRYSCRRNHQAGCGLAFGGPRLEAAIERELLRVLTPGAIEAACVTAEQARDEAVATRRGPGSA